MISKDTVREVDTRMDTKAEPKRVGVYCRVSTLHEEQEESFETQRAAYLQLIGADPNLTLAGIYGDHGITGTSIRHRPELIRMLKDCEEGKIDIVMTKSISRLARNLADCLACVRRLKELGIPIIFEREGINTMDERSELILSILATIAQEESNNLSQNIRWAFEQRSAAGNPVRKTSYGYRKVKDPWGNGSGAWQIHEDEAKRVRYAFEHAARGISYRDMLLGLNEMEEREDTGLEWTQGRLHTLLLNETYIGDILTNKCFTADYLTRRVLSNTGQREQFYLEGHHEPIVDKALFERVGEIVRRGALRSKKRSRVAKTSRNDAV